ncbi:hypothetical protein GCM10007423_59140 [Dyadobacter endophyticus]|uniref:Outer membrane protein beta-barrel domain-containing protein n=1 Tax=Dyadobacter endophyticus TaxID=1749036 RepID=A0ABQ1ZB05_9BACT|nr:hypothetical protein [Dyadobacter endophyticus]GGH53552.1 hypothetical protein GCM10007423_59140 [Dyadobacter endophyticus]
MIELPDDELDKLFRKSSEELDPTYEPDDWNDLRKRLDQQDGRTPAAWWRKWWPLGVLALLIPAGIVLYSYEGENGGKEEGGRNVDLKKDENGGTEERSSGRDVVEGKSGSTSEVVREPGGAAEGATKEDAIVDNGTPAVDKETAAVDNGNRRVESDNGVVDKGNAVVDKRNESVGNSGKVADNTKTNIGGKLKSGSKATGKSSSKSELNAAVVNGGKLLPRSRSKAGGVYLEPNRSKVEGGDGALSITNNANAKGGETSMPQATGQPIGASESVTKVDELGRTLISASALNSKALKWNALQLPGISEPVQELAEAPAPEKPPLPADDQPLMAIRFGYSPDLSTVGLKNFSKPGTAVSLLVEYSVLPRLFLQSGAVWSRKDYYAPASAYKLPKIPHYYPPEMTGVDGICNVLEVPINIRYDIKSGARSRWFASGGFSSYHMNSEKYKYYFVDENDPDIWYRSWKGKTGWYWLSHANVSVGYEYRISKKLSLLAEPSIRMPLKRVGYGKVNLITTGLWLSVRYTPVFK